VKASVLMPVYNREKYVEAAVESILRQTHRDFELLIYDDASTDRTIELVKALALKDERIRPVWGDKFRSHMHGRNVLMDEAKGDVWCWMDSDDLSNKYRLEYQLAEYDPSQYVTCPILWMHDIPEGEPWKHLPEPLGVSEGCFAFAAGMFAPTDLRCDERLTLGGENTDWLEPLCLDRGVEVTILPWALYYCRKHPETVTEWRGLAQNRAELQRQSRIRRETDQKRRAGRHVLGPPTG